MTARIEVFPVAVVVPPAGSPWRELTNRSGRRCSFTRLWYRDDFTAPRAGGALHHACDVFAPQGSLVLAPQAGVVLDIGESPKGGHWLSMYAGPEHGAGRRYFFSHLLERPIVEPGQRVEAGQELAKVGRTGNAITTCPHLHFGIRKAWRRRGGTIGVGQAVNPFPELVAVLPIPAGGLRFPPAETGSGVQQATPSPSTSEPTDPSSSPAEVQA